jgi:hypothetical protein
VINAHDVLDFPSRDVKQPFHKGISVDPSLIMICFPFEICFLLLRHEEKVVGEIGVSFSHRASANQQSHQGFFFLPYSRDIRDFVDPVTVQK